MSGEKRERLPSEFSQASGITLLSSSSYIEPQTEGEFSAPNINNAYMTKTTSGLQESCDNKTFEDGRNDSNDESDGGNECPTKNRVVWNLDNKEEEETFLKDADRTEVCSGNGHAPFENYLQPATPCSTSRGVRTAGYCLAGVCSTAHCGGRDVIQPVNNMAGGRVSVCNAENTKRLVEDHRRNERCRSNITNARVHQGCCHSLSSTSERSSQQYMSLLNDIRQKPCKSNQRHCNTSATVSNPHPTITGYLAPENKVSCRAAHSNDSGYEEFLLPHGRQRQLSESHSRGTGCNDYFFRRGFFVLLILNLLTISVVACIIPIFISMTKNPGELATTTPTASRMEASRMNSQKALNKELDEDTLQSESGGSSVVQQHSNVTYQIQALKQDLEDLTKAVAEFRNRTPRAVLQFKANTSKRTDKRIIWDPDDKVDGVSGQSTDLITVPTAGNYYIFGHIGFQSKHDTVTLWMSDRHHAHKELLRVEQTGFFAIVCNIGNDIRGIFVQINNSSPEPIHHNKTYIGMFLLT